MANIVKFDISYPPNNRTVAFHHWFTILEGKVLNIAFFDRYQNHLFQLIILIPPQLPFELTTKYVLWNFQSCILFCFEALYFYYTFRIIIIGGWAEYMVNFSWGDPIFALPSLHSRIFSKIWNRGDICHDCRNRWLQKIFPGVVIFVRKQLEIYAFTEQFLLLQSNFEHRRCICRHLLCFF